MRIKIIYNCVYTRVSTGAQGEQRRQIPLELEFLSWVLGAGFGS